MYLFGNFSGPQQLGWWEMCRCVAWEALPVPCAPGWRQRRRWQLLEEPEASWEYAEAVADVKIQVFDRILEFAPVSSTQMAQNGVDVQKILYDEFDQYTKDYYR